MKGQGKKPENAKTCGRKLEKVKEAED